MSKYLSNKIKAISFFLIVLVVFTHSSNLINNMNGSTKSIHQGYNSFIQDFISQGITRVAVPLFFIVSGYLFFLNIKNGSRVEFLSKYRRRIHTLVLPYLFWSVYGVLFYLILQSIPISQFFFTKELIRDYSINLLLSTIFLHPIPYQLWFIRDLVVLVFISPLIYWLIKHMKYFAVLFFFMTWLVEVNFFILSNRSILFFIVGAFLSIQGIELQNLKFQNQYLLFTMSWIILAFCKTLLTYVGFENNWTLEILHKISVLIGILAVWLIYDRLFKNTDISNFKFYSIFQYTFFLYVFHEPILTILQKILYFILGVTELSSFLTFIFVPVLTIIIAILTGFCLKRILPRFYNLITGRRSNMVTKVLQ